MFLGTFNAADIVWCPSPDLCLDTIHPRGSTHNFLRVSVFLFLIHLQKCLSFFALSLWGIVCRLMDLFNFISFRIRL